MTHGRIAHIHGHSPKGPRWAAPLDPVYVDSYENLVLLCQYHHDLVDGDASEFHVEEIRSWKQEHETRTLRAKEYRALGSLPPRLVSPYVQRPAVMTALNVAIETGRPVAVRGLAGAGKSQLVSEHYREAEDRYTQRFWITGSSRENIETELAEIAHAMGGIDLKKTLTTDAARVAVEMLDRVPGYLLVIDGVSDFDQIRGLLPDSGALIVVSQSQGWPGFESLQVPGFTVAESVDLLSHFTDEGEEDSLRDIATLCGGHPLLLSQAGRYIVTRSIQPTAYLELLKSHGSELLDRGSADEHSTLSTSLQLVAAELNNDAKLLAATLANLSDSTVLVDARPEADHPLDLFGSRLRIEDALAQLLRYSLVEREGQEVRMHGIVQEFFREPHDPGVRFLGFSAAIMLVILQTPRHVTNAQERRLFTHLIPHMEGLLARGDEYVEMSGLALSMIANRLGGFYVESGRVALGEQILRRGESLASNGGTDSTRASLAHNIANASFERGDLEKALEGALAALEMKRSCHVEGVDSESFLAYTYILIGDIFGKMGVDDQAVTYNELAAAAFTAAGDWALAAGALLSIAILLLEKEEEERLPDVKALLDRVDALMLKPGSGSFMSQQIRAAMVHTGYCMATSDWPSAARHALIATRLAREDRPNGLAVARAQLVHARSLRRLGLLARSHGILSLAEDHLGTVDVAVPIEVEKVRGNIGAAFIEAECVSCGLRLIRSSFVGLQALLPETHPTVHVAAQLVERAENHLAFELALGKPLACPMGRTGSASSA